MSVLSYLSNCEVLSTVTQEQDEATWLANRSRGIGGSDIGIIMGVNKYSSPRLLYLKKTGQYDEGEGISDESRERMYWGHILEPIVANEFEKRTGKKVVLSPATLRHKEHKHRLANIDRLIVDESGKPYGVLECKTADARMNRDWEEGEVPISYIYQLQWYLGITGLEYGAFAALIGGNKFHIIEVFRNDDLIEEMCLAADTFWNYNIMNLVQPELSGNDADTDYIKDQYGNVVKDSEVTLAEEEWNKLAEIVVTGKQQIKLLEKTVEEASNKLKEKLQDTELGYTTDYTVKWSPRVQRRVDTEVLKTEFPDVYNKVAKQISYRVFTVKGMRA